MHVRAQVAMVMNLDKCIGCHTCSVTCKQVWTNRPGHRVRLVQQRRDRARPGLSAPVGRPGALERRLGARPQGAAAAEGRRAGQEAADDLLQPRPAGDRRLLRAVHLRLRDARRRAARRPATRSPARTRSSPASRWTSRGARTGTRGSPAARSRAPLDPHLRAMQEEVRLTYEQAFMFFLPRICEHCLNPSCVASCPSGAMYKREEDGIVLVDQDKCRGWRYCVSGCPYKKVYFNHRTGKAEKCTLCYPRIEIGQPTICSETCVGRIRYLGLVLYDSDRVEAAASVPDERDLLAAQRDVFLDPEDPEVREAARARRDPGRLDRRPRAARRSMTWRCAGAWRCRCTPSSGRCRWSGTCRRSRRSSRRSRPTATRPTPTTSSARSTHLRIPLEYLANLLTRRRRRADPLRAAPARGDARLHAQARGARRDRRGAAGARRPDRAPSSSACTGCWRSPTTRTAT